MDRPNMNWKVLEKLDFSKTLNIASCSQYIICGAFKNASMESNWNGCELLKAMYSILDDYSWQL